MDDSLTVMQYKSKPVARRTNIIVHFCAHQLFDKIAQQDDEDLKEVEDDEPLLADVMIEDCFVDATDDETEACITSNRDQSEEEYKPVMLVATSSQSWCEDVYEKPSLVV